MTLDVKNAELNIHNEMDKTFKELLLLLSSLKQEQLNVVPFEGSWTAGQVARHLIKSMSGFVQLLKGPAKETEDREPDEKTEIIKRDLLDFETKTKTTDLIYPEEADYNKRELLLTLRNLTSEISNVANSQDLSKTCLLFEIPVYGFLTRYEALYFITYHTRRHIHQIRTIYRKVRMNSLIIRSGQSNKSKSVVE